eukprot:Rmarinus@m.17666
MKNPEVTMRWFLFVLFVLFGTFVHQISAAPVISAVSTSTSEDNSVQLSITPVLGDGSAELRKMYILNIPGTVKFPGVVDTSSEFVSGTYTLTANSGTGFTSNAKLTTMSLNPSSSCDVDFTVSVHVVEVIDGDPSETTSTAATIGVLITADADAPTMSATGGSVDEDARVKVNVTPTRGTDTDNSEWLRLLSVHGLPAAAGTDGDVTFSAVASSESAYATTKYTVTSTSALGFSSG